MAGIVQLGPGGSAQAPTGAVSIKLSSTVPAQLVLMTPSGEVVEPQFRVSPSEAVVVAGEALVVTARPTLNQPFASGTRIGVSFRNPGGAGSEIVRPAVEVGGQQSVTLVRIGADGLITDALEDGRRMEGEGLWARPWMKPGAYAYHVNHHQSAAMEEEWSLVLDGSATMLAARRREGLGRFLETLIGVVSTALGSGPRAVLVSTDPARDAVAALDADAIDWAAAIGEDPAPWPSVTSAVRRSSGAVVVVLDGVPVDYRELTAWARESGRRMIVVAVGRSRHGLEQSDRPAQFWDEELAALSGLAELDRVTVVSTVDLGSVVEHAPQFADALFPVRSAS